MSRPGSSPRRSVAVTSASPTPARPRRWRSRSQTAAGVVQSGRTPEVTRAGLQWPPGRCDL
eukprot:9041249-Heterocapsa_arctica.AAC.1